MPNSQKNAKKIIGATVAGVLLITFLLIVVIIQLVQIGVKRADIQKLEEEKVRLEQALEDDRRALEYYQSYEYLQNRAYAMQYFNQGN